MNCFLLAGTYDQLNVGALASFELLARRAQAIAQAYKHGSGGKPNFGTANLFMGEDAGEDGVTVGMKHYISKQAKEVNELETITLRALTVVGRTKDSDDTGADAPPAGQPAGSSGGPGGGGARGRGNRRNPMRAPAPT